MKFVLFSFTLFVAILMVIITFYFDKIFVFGVFAISIYLGFLLGIIKGFKLLEQALTPPTQEEVCKALSELTPHGQSVLYSELEKTFYYESVHYNGFEDENYITQLTHYQNGELIIRHGYKPHLIILIGRFYEGLEK
jgi:hypothetical protein